MTSTFIEHFTKLQVQSQKTQSIKMLYNQYKKLSQNEVQKQIQQNYNQLYPILKTHPQLFAQFVFQSLSIEECFDIMKFSKAQLLKNQTNIGFRMFCQISNQAQNSFIQWFSKMYTRYSNIEKLLVFLRLMALFFHTNTKENFISEFLADYIKASATIIQQFLKLKSQQPKFDLDYLQFGQEIVKSTQKWVKESYIILLKSLSINTYSKNIRISILNAIGDIIGAVLQVQRQGNIQFCICQQILNSCYQYIKTITSIDQLNQLYLDKLRKEKYNIPIQKIMIPNYYISQFAIPKSAYAYLIHNFVIEAQGFKLYSDQKLFKILIPLLNEIVNVEYKFKQTMVDLLCKVLENIKMYTCFESQFPLSILWFNLSHFSQKANQKALNSIVKIYKNIQPQTLVNSLKILTYYHVQGLQSQISNFIAEKCIFLSNQSPKLLVGLTRLINFNNLNEKGQALWLQIIDNLSKNNIEIKTIYSKISNQNKFKMKLTQILKKNDN